MTDKELIETAKQAMKDLWELNQGRLLEHEQTAYNCLRLFCERLEQIEKSHEITDKEYKNLMKQLYPEPRRKK